MKLDDLKKICRTYSLNSRVREKQVLVDRILELPESAWIGRVVEGHARTRECSSELESGKPFTCPNLTNIDGSRAPRDLPLGTW